MTILWSFSYNSFVTFHVEKKNYPGVVSLIPARSHTFLEIDHEIIPTVIFVPFIESFKKGCCQFQAKYVHKVLAYCLFKLAHEKFG